MFTLISSVSSIPSESLSRSLRIVAVIAGCLLLWRLWRFSLKPLLNPREPKELPYWIPVLGYAIPFFKDAEATFRYARQYFGNTREPFTLTIAGQKMYILMSPKDHSTVYKNPTLLTFDGFIRDLYASFGMSKEGINKMWQAQTSVIGDKPKQVHLGQGVHREQLHPGPHLEDITAVYLEQIEQSLRWDRIPDLTPHEGQAKLLSLFEWCADVLGNATIRALYGETLLDLEPDLLQHFYNFDAESWKLTFQLPRMFAKRMHDAKDKSRDAYIRYFQLPAEKRPGTCYYLRCVEEKQRQAGMTDEDIGVAAQMFFWGANANPFKVCFWLLCYLFHDQILLEQVRGEIDPCVTLKSIDLERLLNQCPVLEACFNETLRVTSVNSSARNVETPVFVGDKCLSIDGKILMPYRQLHLEENVFGPNTTGFNHKRFLLNKDLSRSANFKPFGGGSTLCSGRFIAKREVLAFVAFAIQRYDIAPENTNQPFPRMDQTKPTLGIMDPVITDHIRCTMQLRRPEESLLVEVPKL